MWVSQSNNTSTPLSSGATFTGGWEAAPELANTVVASLKTDQAGTLYFDFSTDASNADSTISFGIAAATNEVHRLTITKKYVRIRIENTAAGAQTYLRAQTVFGNHQHLTSALNATTQQDADAIVSKSISEELLIAEGKISGYSIVNKFGLNSDIDSGTVPEDVWEGGGVYTGWATGAETVTVLSSSANDTSAGTGARTIRITGLDANYAEQSETITLNGTTPVATTNTYIRVHTARVVSAGSGGSNAGTITVRQTTTSANIFLSLQIGRNQSNCSAYTAPAGKTAYMRKLHVACGTAANVAIEGSIYVKAFGEAFRYRRPFFVSDSFRVFDQIFGGLVFTEKTDIMLRITSCSANNTPVNGGYDLIVVDN